MSRILSGIQTSGMLHLGNYLGAIQHWVKLQEEVPSYFFLADLHAITVDYAPEKLRESILTTAAIYLACGIMPEKAAIFAQSSVPEHAELMWLFSCLTPLGWLNRMTQFKEKAGKNREQASLGLYSYPVLMSADILLYQPSHVPVGEDQKQHLELTRDIAGAFNRFVGHEYFSLPEPLILGEATRVMSLRDGTKKMSKSDSSEQSRINLDDSNDDIRLKIQRAKTDSGVVSAEGISDRPELNNLVSIMAALQNKTKEEILEEYEGQGFARFKQDLTELLIMKIAPIRDLMRKYLIEPDYIESVLRIGAMKARELASKHIEEIRHHMGYINLYNRSDDRFNQHLRQAEIAHQRRKDLDLE